MAAPRLTVVEAPIDALSLAALEGPRADTLYLATAGSIGPGTIKALGELLAERARHSEAELGAATDADPAGDRYAAFLTELAVAADVRAARLRPPHGVGDWNELLVRARARAGGGQLMSRSTQRSLEAQARLAMLGACRNKMPT